MSNMIFPGQKLFVPGEDYVPTGYHSLSASPRPQTHIDRTTTATLLDIEPNDDSKKTKKSTFLQEPPPSDKQNRRSSDSSQTNSQNALNTTTTTTFITVNVEYIADITTMCLVAGNLSVFDNEIKFEPDITTLTKQQLDDVDKYQLTFTRTSINVNILDSLPSNSDLMSSVAQPGHASSNDFNQPVTVNTNSDSNHDSSSVQDTCQDSSGQEREQDTVPDSTPGSNVGDSVTCIRPTFRIGCETTQKQHEEDQTDNTTTADGTQTVYHSDVKYLCIKFGIPSKAAQDRPTISSLIKSFLPTVDWIQHYFVIRNESFDELSAAISRLFPADEADETLDTVTSDIPHSKQRTKPVYRRTLSAAELYNLPLPELSHSSNILTETHIRTLREHLPPRADGRSWLLVYSTSRDGCSINTMYRRLEGVDSPVLLILRDNNSRVFGAVLSCEPRVSESFYGNGEIFLFTFYPTFKKYSWTGDNNYFIKGNTDSLIIGSGDAAFGLWLDDSLYRGRTQYCDTFHNEPLTADNEDFTVQCLETWSFPWSF